MSGLSRWPAVDGDGEGGMDLCRRQRGAVQCVDGRVRRCPERCAGGPGPPRHWRSSNGEGRRRVVVKWSEKRQGLAGSVAVSKIRGVGWRW